MTNYNDLLNALDRKNGEHITMDGKDYYFTQQPYMDNGPDCEAHYFAIMISDSDAPDDDGVVPAYMATWDIFEDWDTDDEADACDWDVPSDIEQYCWYDTIDRSVC